MVGKEEERKERKEEECGEVYEAFGHERVKVIWKAKETKEERRK